MKKQNLVKTLFNLFIIQLLFYVDACAMSKPEKFLEIVANSEGASYYIKFNDVKVFSETSNSPVRQTLPLNHWANNTENNILVSVNFRKNDPLQVASNSKLKLSVFIRTKQGGNETSHLLSEFNISPSDLKPEEIASSSKGGYQLSSQSYKKSETGDISITPWVPTPKKNWIRFSQNIKINLGLPEWAYLSADTIEGTKKLSDKDFFSLRDELYTEYKKLWALMNDKNIDALLELTNLRSGEMNEAFYLEPDSKHSDMRKSLTSAFDNEDLNLYELIDKKIAKLTIMANGKIANIKVSRTNVSPILFTHSRDSFTRSYDFFFMKKDGKWIIIR